MDYYRSIGDVLISHLDELETFLPYCELIGKCMAKSIIAQSEYEELEAIPDGMRRRRATILKVYVRPPELIEKFCYLLQDCQQCSGLGQKLVRECHLRKRQLIEQLRRESSIAKMQPSDHLLPSNNPLLDAAQKENLEQNHARLEQQLEELQLEVQKWKDACFQVERRLVESQATQPQSYAEDRNLLIGIGKYGISYKVKHQDHWYAGKIIHKCLYVDCAKVIEAWHTYAKFNHPNLEALIAVKRDNGEGIPIFLSELFPMNLNYFIHHCKTNLKFSEQWNLCEGMAKGLNFLHQKNIIHTSLHGRNILINHQNHAKIGGFVCPQLQKANVIHATKGYSDFEAYVAPELSADGVGYSLKSDMFALGILFLQVLSQEVPTANNNLMKLAGCHPMQQLLNLCINHNPETRPNCMEVCDQLISINTSSQSFIYECLQDRKGLPSLVGKLQDGKGQITWKPLSNLPYPMYSAYVVKLGNNLYVAGGIGPDRRVEHCVFEFSLIQCSWHVLSEATQKSAVPHIINDKLVLLGGCDVDTNQITRKVSTYSKENDSWSHLFPDMIECRCYPVVVSHKNHVVVAGGKSRGSPLPMDDIEVMNTVDCHWIQLKSCLPKCMHSCSAAVSDNKLYLVRTIGGSLHPSGTQQAYSISMEEFIPPQDVISGTLKDKWTILPDVPHRNVTITPYLYPPLLVGGSNAQGNTYNELLLFDGSWRKVGMLTWSRARVAVATISDNAVIVLGGCTDSQTKDTCKSSAVSTVELGYMDAS